LEFYLNKPADVPPSIFSKIKNMLRRKPAERPAAKHVTEEIFFHVFNRPRARANDPVAALDNLDSWLIDMYQSILQKSATVSETIHSVKLCFLRNMSASTFQPFFNIGITTK
jgi:hypothetical protein